MCLKPEWILALTLLLVCLVVDSGFGQAAEPAIEPGDTYLDFYKRLNEAEFLLLDDYLMTAADEEYLQSLVEELAATPFEDLHIQSRSLVHLGQEKIVLQELVGRQDELYSLQLEELKLTKRKERRRLTNTIGIWTTLGVGLASFGVSYLYWYLSEKAEEDRLLAQTIDEAVRLRDDANRYSTMSYILVGIGTVSLGASITLLAVRSSR